jgi:prepilin-type N-terminal cleavage/methylation domain-containing protein
MSVMKKQKAFTLVELLVVIAIIAVLLSILIPGLRHVKEVAKRVRCANNGLRTIGMAMKFYGDTYDGKLPNLESSIGTAVERLDHPYWICRDFTTDAAGNKKWKTVFGFGCLSLSSAKLIDNPVIFYCPADDLWKDIYNSYATPAPWGTAASHPNDPRYLVSANGSNAQDIIRVTYIYYPETKKSINLARLSALGGAGTGSTYEENCPEIALKVADMDSSKAISCDNGGHALGGTTKATDSPELNKGHNALFGDGHVVFQRAPTRVLGDGSIAVTHIRQEAEGASAVNNVAYFMSHLQP